MAQIIKWSEYHKSTIRPPVEMTLTPEEQLLILNRLLELNLINRAFHWAMHMMEVAR